MLFFTSEIFRHIWRNKGRSLLSLSIAALLVSFIGLYMGNIKKNEVTLKNLADTIPVIAQISNRNGSRDIGMEINTHTLDVLLSADIIDPIYTALAGGNLNPINRVEPLKMCDTTILGANSILALNTEDRDAIDFGEGWNETFLEEDKPLCLVRKTYAMENDISIGDTLTFPMNTFKYNKDGFSIKFLKVGDPTLTVVGIITEENISNETQEMIVPVNWLRLFVEQSGNSLYYDSAKCTINNPLQLNDFKTYMEEMNIGEVNLEADDRISGDKLMVQDKIFIETASKLQDNLNLFRWFQFLFFILIVFLIILVSFLILRSYQKEMAIASSLGRPKLISATSYFLENLLLYLFGCILVLPMLAGVTGIGMFHMIPICLLFLVGACIGIWGALALLLHFDTLALLTKID